LLVGGSGGRVQLQSVFVRWRATTQACDEPVPPQSTVIVDVAAFQLPVQPVRFDVPSVSAALSKLPALPIDAFPLIAAMDPPDTRELSWMSHLPWGCRMHWRADAFRSPQPAPSMIVSE
jgi:hypothetical protein